MSLSEADIAFARELFAELGEISTRKMFGGCSLYLDGQIFGILDHEGQLYLKAKGAFAEALQAAGGRPFRWVRPSDGREVGMGYVTLPESALDQPDEACQWARRAIEEIGA